MSQARETQKQVYSSFIVVPNPPSMFFLFATRCLHIRIKMEQSYSRSAEIVYPLGTLWFFLKIWFMLKLILIKQAFWFLN